MKLILIPLFGVLLSCQSNPININLKPALYYQNNDCYASELHQLGSYDDVIYEVENNKEFKLAESKKTPQSSWVTGAAFYSCNNNTGYLILIPTKGYKYIHEGVPLKVWQGFKNATDFGQYYDYNIRGRFRFKL